MLIESPSVGRLLEEVAGPYPMCAWNWGWGYQGDSINMVGLTDYIYIFMGVSNIKATCFCFEKSLDRLGHHLHTSNSRNFDISWFTVFGT